MTPDDLRAIMPNAGANAVAFCEPINQAMAEFDISDSADREAAFVAQIAHETMELRHLKELWGPTEQQKKYEPPHQKAQELGNTQPGDGFRFRGRGLIQITGRANYADCGVALGLPLLEHPELLEQPENACRSAAWWWKQHGCNEIADRGDFKALTRRINGGLNGYDDRVAHWERAKDVLA